MRSLVIAAILISAPAMADTIIEVQTPALRHVYADCEVTETHIDRHGTVSVSIAECAQQDIRRQVPVWAPQPHPDGLPLLFDSRLRVSGKIEPFQRCEMIGYAVTPFGSWQSWECLDDPVTRYRARR